MPEFIIQEQNPLEEVETALNNLRIDYGQLRWALGEHTISEIIENKDVFDTLTAHEKDIFASDRLVLKQTIEKYLGEDVQKLRGALMVNLGSGWDYHGRLMHDEYGINVIGLEILPLVVSQAKVKNEGKKMVEVTANIEDAPIPNNSVDLVFSHGTIRYLEGSELSNTVSELVRILKPENDGGLAIIGDVDRIAVENFRKELEKRGIEYDEETRNVEFFKGTRFYCLFTLYNNLEFSDPSIKDTYFGNELIEKFKLFVDSMAEEEGITPIQTLIEMAGTEKKTLTYFIIRKHN